jgi:hypothetical protein
MKLLAIVSLLALSAAPSASAGPVACGPQQAQVFADNARLVQAFLGGYFGYAAGNAGGNRYQLAKGKIEFFVQGVGWVVPSQLPAHYPFLAGVYFGSGSSEETRIRSFHALRSAFIGLLAEMVNCNPADPRVRILAGWGNEIWVNIVNMWQPIVTDEEHRLLLP